jgi:hypothetical protein
MVINFTPSPQISTIVRSIFSKSSSGDSWKRGGDSVSATFYSRGMWALHEGVIQILASKKKNTGVVWLPDYYCNDTLTPLRTQEITLRFYPVLRNLTPDWNSIEDQIKLNGIADIFILVHYFGFPSPTQKAIGFCYNNGMILIEDGAHVLIPSEGIGDKNMIIYSPRKLLSIPEIGILLSSKSLSKEQQNKKLNLGFLFIFKWLLKRIVQKLLKILNINWHSLKENSVSNNTPDTKLQLPNKLSMQLLKVYEKKLNIYGDKRRNNYLRLETLIHGLETIEPLFKKLPNGIIPYMLPIIVRNHHFEIKGGLKNKGIPASSWPDIPPEVIESGGGHDHALWLNQHLLLLPIHQSLRNKEIDYIASSLKSITENI